jgi:hypothetical protein
MRTADRLAGLGIDAELARLRDFLARDVLLGVLDLLDERLPELLERRRPVSSPRDTASSSSSIAAVKPYSTYLESAWSGSG